MTYDDYKSISETLPHSPGVYRFINDDGTVLYIGKAKNLKNRISSYFTGGRHSAYKTRVMVKNAADIEYTIVETEHDALLLENTLIKKYQPRYNVNLKDGKSYTYICIKNERFPRVFFTRRVLKDGSEYFGPYTSKYKARIVLDMIRSLFPLRTCTYNLSEKNIKAGKFKVCLEYHIKNCMGPCEGLESEEDYMEKITQVRNMLKGHFSEVKKHLRKEMNEMAENLEFEQAEKAKVRLDALGDYQSKSTVVSTNIRDLDVFSIADDDKTAYVNYLKIIDGAIINSYTVELVKNLDEDPEDLLSYAILDLRDKFDSISPEIVAPFEVPLIEADVAITVPRRGDKRKLLELSEKNGQYFLLQKKKEAATARRKQTSAERILNTLKDDLQMEDVPLHIECFDNSNLHGAQPVASCVVFKNARPAKKDYRHYNIKTVEGPDDFASMTEVVRRRYGRMIKEEESLPQLIIIDGGKGQLSSAMKSIKDLGIEDDVTVIGIAKKLEEIYFPGDSIPLYINKKSESLKLIQQARNEAHRFAISFHRNKRSKAFLQTELTVIPGIGEKTANKLLKSMGSVKAVANADQEELKKHLNLAQTKAVWDYFHSD
ncbi:MAG: excinuclease ABC subunit UvrC [Saprospiraceae bacterium]|nr:excinuclease ABC subunit UvrC [Saprospiraceae bacterium]